MWTMLGEVADEDAGDVLELAAAEDEQSVEAFPAHAADPALRGSVSVRRPDRRADDADAFALEDAVECAMSSFGSSATTRTAYAPTGRAREHRAGVGPPVGPVPGRIQLYLSASGRFRRYCFRDHELERVPVWLCAFRCTFVKQSREV
jgi:hypothetical protein